MGLAGDERPGAAGPPDGSDVSLANVDEPSPPRPPLTGSESVKLIGGLVVVCSGLLVLVAIAIVGMLLVGDDSSNVVAVATSAFGVIGTVVGAYFGLKIGTDGTQTAVSGLRHEAAKAQAFAAHVPKETAAEAIAQATALAGGATGSAPTASAAPGAPPPAGGNRP